MKKLFSKSLSIYKSHPLVSWILAIFCGLVISGLTVLCVIDTIMVLFLLPFVILPFFFACYMLHLGLSYGNELTIGGFSRFFLLYFKKPFNGCFSAIKALIRYLIASLLFEVLFGLIAYIICVSIDSGSFYAMIEAFMEVMTSIEEPAADIKVVLGENYWMYNLFMDISTIPTAIASFIYFVYVIFYNSGSIYLRAKFRNINGRFLAMVFKFTTKNVAKTYKKDFFSIEWPLFLLMVIGGGLGAYLPILIYGNSALSIIFGIAGSLILSMFYLPFHFANMEVLFNKYEDSFKTGINEITQSMINNFQKQFTDAQKFASEVEQEEEDENNKKT